MLLGIFILACGNKNTEPAPPPVGWYQEEGWSHSCYHPPDYNTLLAGDRSEARENALTALLEQWNGKRGDGVSFTPEVIEEIEFKELRPEDYKLWIDLIYVKRNQSILIDKKLAFYRISDYQRSKNKFKSLFRINNFFLKLPNTSYLKRKFNIFKWIFFNILERLFIKKLNRKDYIEYIKFLGQ